ncbi:MAG: tetratricopeptide repeat protein [Bacteroidales bacterium]|nr:tetratricopeptide repeat protein [Bacteroidales bacterium]
MKRVYYLTALLFVAAALTGQPYSPADSIRWLFNEGDYRGVINKSAVLIKNNQSDRHTWYFLGKAYAGLFNYDSASICYENALKHNPTDPAVLNALASSLVAGRKLKKAEAIYKAVLQSNPGNIEARVNLAGIYSRLGNDMEAKNIYTGLYTENPGNLHYTLLLAACYNALDIKDSAIFYYEKCLHGNPGDFTSVVKLSGLYLKSKEYQKGFEITGKYLANDSLNIPVLKLNAYFSFLLENYDDAIKSFTLVTELGDSSFMAMKYLGLSYIKKEDMYLAAQYLHKARNLDTTDFEACMYLGISTGWTINKEAGIEYLKKAFGLINPPDETVVRIYRELADLYAAWNKPAEAIEYYTKILGFKTNNRLVLFKMANVYENTDKQSALKWYQDFMKTRDPDHAPVQTNAEGLIIVSYYDIAEQRIKKLKEELFFEGKLNAE